MIGGYLFHGSDGVRKAFWKKKFKRLIIPWVFCGTLTYSLYALRIHDFHVLSYLKWILGSGTWLYYATVYVFFLIIFEVFSIDKKEKILVACVILSGLMLLIETVKPEHFIFIWGWYTPYLNMLNWIGFFSLGVLIKKRGLLVHILNQKMLILATLTFLISLLLLYLNSVYTYFHIISSLMELSACIILLNISYLFARTWYEIAIIIGQSTYFIFLTHMQIVQFLCNRLPEALISDCLRPMIGLLVMTFIVLGVKYICKKVDAFARFPMLVGL